MNALLDLRVFPYSSANYVFSFGGMMRSINRYLAGGFFSIAFLFSTGARAMEIADFDQMPNKDKSAYLIFIVDGSADLLQKAGKTADSQKLLDLFSNTQPGQKLPQGNQQFLTNLDASRDLNKKNANNPDQLIEMEQVFSITFSNFGIDVPVANLETLSSNFKPSSSSAANGPLITEIQPPPAPGPGKP